MRPQAVQIGRARLVRQAEGGGQPPYGDARRIDEIVPRKQALERAVVLMGLEDAGLKALAVAVSRAVDAALEDVRGCDWFEHLAVSREEQPRLCAALSDHYVQLAHVLAEDLAQAGRPGGISVQADAVQRVAVHQRVTAEVAHRGGEFQLLQPAAVVKRVPAHTAQMLGQRDCANGIRVVHGFRPAAGDADAEGAASGKVGSAFAQRVIPERDHRCTADLVRQAHVAVACLAPQDGNAVRLCFAGQQKVVFALDRTHGAPPFTDFCSVSIIAQTRRIGNQSSMI